MADEKPDEQPELSEEEVEKASSLLDLRRIIGGLLGVYGLMLLGAGLFASEADKEKAAGVNINLWVAFALLAASALFIVWSAHPAARRRTRGRRRGVREAAREVRARP